MNRSALSMLSLPSLLASLTITPQALGQPISSRMAPFVPAITVSAAVVIAEQYAKEHRVSLDGQYIRCAELRYDSAPSRRDHYWLIQWAWSSPRIGGEYGVKVYMDGTVVPQPCGP
jgi:hypothetical protein